MVVINVAPALNGLEQPIILQQQLNSVIEGINVPSIKNYNLVGVVQPLDLRKLKITPSEQAEFGTHMVHIRQTILQNNSITLTLLNSQNFLFVFKSQTFRIMGKWLYNDYGYAQVDAAVNRS